jgi:hypothetical protein
MGQAGIDRPSHRCCYPTIETCFDSCCGFCCASPYWWVLYRGDAARSPRKPGVFGGKGARYVLCGTNFKLRGQRAWDPPEYEPRGGLGGTVHRAALPFMWRGGLGRQGTGGIVPSFTARNSEHVHEGKPGGAHSRCSQSKHAVHSGESAPST